MSRSPGQNPGHAATRQAPAEPTEPAGEPGLSWAELLAGLVESYGTLTAVAWRLVEHADGDDVASVERALRRLRGRGQLDGGLWGQRVLRVFGVPAPVEARLRWMGLYHSPFNDLPIALCLDQLRLWDRPPVAASRARAWLHLGRASCALRGRQLAEARAHVARCHEALASAASGHDDARLEALLVEAFAASRDEGAAAVARLLDRAAALLAGATLPAADRACFEARLADQRAYQLNRAGDVHAALALYQALPAADLHPFASYRRDAGLAYGHHRLGETALARQLAERACQHAGDGGYVRLRAMGLLLLARIAGAADPGDPGDLSSVAAAALRRAAAIAERLDDGELRARVTAAGASHLEVQASGPGAAPAVGAPAR